MNQPGPSADAVPAHSEHANARGRLLLVRFAATLALFALYQTTGLSQSLLAGLASRFQEAWWPVHLVYLTVTLSGLGALLFPFALYEDFVLQTREHGEELEFDDWLPGAVRDFAIDLLLGIVFFTFLCGLVQLAGRYWWLPASIVYGLALVVIGLSQQLRGDAVDEVEDLAAGAARDTLLRAVADVGVRVGRIVCRVDRDGGSEPMLYATGLGRRCRLVVSEALLRDLDEPQLHAYAVQELASLRARDLMRGHAMNAGLSLLAFAAAEGLFELLARLDLASPDTPARFPLFAASLLATTFAALPLAHAYARHRVHEADRAAARLAGAASLRSALETLHRDEPETAASAPFDVMLHPMPSAGQRIARLARLEKRT